MGLVATVLISLLFLLLAVAADAKGITVGLRSGASPDLAYSATRKLLLELKDPARLRASASVYENNMAVDKLLDSLESSLGKRVGAKKRADGAAAAPSFQFMDDFMEYLARDSTKKRIQTLARKNSSVLDGPVAIDRSKLCRDIRDSQMALKTKRCICNGEAPLLYCEALLFKDFKKQAQVFDELWDESMVFDKSMADASPLKYQDVNENSTNSGRKLLQVGYCRGSFTRLDQYIDGSSGCVSIDCTAWLLPTMTLQMKVTGCVPNMRIAGAMGTMFLSGKPYQYTMAQLASTYRDWTSQTADAHTSIYLGVGLYIPVLSELLGKVGVSMPGLNSYGKWYPLKGQVYMDTRVNLAWLSWAGVRGTGQYNNARDNAICTLKNYNSWWGCKNYCQWNRGNGQLAAYVGVSAGWFSGEKSVWLVNNGLRCNY